MGERLNDKRCVTDGLRLAPALSWLLTVLFCPLETAVAFPEGCAVTFVGGLMLGCALACVASAFGLAAGLEPRFGRAAQSGRASRSGRARPMAPLFFLLPAGVLVAVLAAALGVPAVGVWIGLSSAVAGLGEGAILLAWGRRLSSCPTGDALRTLAVACAGAAVLAPLFVAAALSPAVMRLLLVVLALASAVLALGAERAAGCAVGGSVSSSAGVPNAAEVGSLVGRLWEPVLGLGFSFMSAVLPWGSFLAGSETSIPVAWSFAVGLVLAGGACWLIVARMPGGPARFGFDAAIHIAVPVLAAVLVGLRMFGDPDELSDAASFAKGVASGVASAGFIVFGLLAMVREARLRGGSPLPVGLGLGVACAVGFAILPLHVVSQQVAALAAPFLSLAFLAVACCSSIVHLWRRGEVQPEVPAPAALSIEEAARVICRRFGLSSREEQVLFQLILGRSAESIGAVLGISPNTVRSHIGSIHGKLGIGSRNELADLIEATQREPLGEASRENASSTR